MMVKSFEDLLYNLNGGLVDRAIAYILESVGFDPLLAVGFFFW